MASNYNSRNRPAEVLISDGREGPIHNLIREREKYEEQFAKETLVSNINLHSLNIQEESESKEDLTENGENVNDK